MFRSLSRMAVKLALVVGLSVALTGAIGIFVVDFELAAYVFMSGPSLEGSGEVERLQAGITPLIERLKKYRERRGCYPETLESIGEETPTTRFGPWTYHCYRAGQAFSLRLGDYQKNGFVLLWDSLGGEWHIDI